MGRSSGAFGDVRRCVRAGGTSRGRRQQGNRIGGRRDTDPARAVRAPRGRCPKRQRRPARFGDADHSPALLRALGEGTARGSPPSVTSRWGRVPRPPPPVPTAPLPAPGVALPGQRPTIGRKSARPAACRRSLFLPPFLPPALSVAVIYLLPRSSGRRSRAHEAGSHERLFLWALGAVSLWKTNRSLTQRAAPDNRDDVLISCGETSCKLPRGLHKRGCCHPLRGRRPPEVYP